LEPSDDNWIGAWWIPFLADALLGLILFIFLFGYPNQIPGSAIVKRERDKTNTIYSTISSTKTLLRFKRIISNPVWIFATIGGIWVVGSSTQ